MSKKTPSRFVSAKRAIRRGLSRLTPVQGRVALIALVGVLSLFLVER